MSNKLLEKFGIVFFIALFALLLMLNNNRIVTAYICENKAFITTYVGLRKPPEDFGVINCRATQMKNSEYKELYKSIYSTGAFK